MTDLYSIALRLENRRCLVVGGGRVAERKVAALLNAAAEVVVVAPEVTPALRALAAQGRITLHKREAQADDVTGATLVIAATDIPQVNEVVWQTSRDAGVLVNTADVPTHCDFYTPAMVRRSPVTLAINTNGRSPALSAWLRRHLEAALPTRLGELAETLGALRPQVSQTIPDMAGRAAFWNRIVDDELVALAEREGMDAVRERVKAALLDWSPKHVLSEAEGSPDSGRHQEMPDADLGVVYLVGAGPGDPELITVRGARCLERADVVVYDRLVSPELLNLAPPEATRIFVGKRPGKPSTPQETINQLLVDHARAGLVVIRLKGGDPFVFGRGGEEALALAEAEVPFEVVPGVTAAVAVPAVAGIPVTQRGLARSFAVVTGQTRNGSLPELPNADTLVVLMTVNPLSRIAAALLAQGRPPTTPAAVIAAGTTPCQQVVCGTLADIANQANGLKPPALLVVGEVVRLREALNSLKLETLYSPSR